MLLWYAGLCQMFRVTGACGESERTTLQAMTCDVLRNMTFSVNLCTTYHFGRFFNLTTNTVIDVPVIVHTKVIYFNIVADGKMTQYLVTG